MQFEVVANEKFIVTALEICFCQLLSAREHFDAAIFVVGINQWNFNSKMRMVWIADTRGQQLRIPMPILGGATR